MALTSGRLGAGVATGPSDTGNLLKRPQPKPAEQAAQGPQGPSMGNSSFPTYDQNAQVALTQGRLAQELLQRQKLALPAQYELGAGALRNTTNADLARIGVNQGLLGQERGFANRGFDLASQLLNNSRSRDLRMVGESATARGATVSQGHRSELDEINTAHQGQLGQAALGRDKALAGLDAEAAKMGISAGELRRNLDIGLAKLGLQGQLSADEINAMLTSGNVELAALARSVMDQAGNTDFTLGIGPSLGLPRNDVPKPGSATAAYQAAQQPSGLAGQLGAAFPPSIAGVSPEKFEAGLDNPWIMRAWNSLFGGR